MIRVPLVERAKSLLNMASNNTTTKSNKILKFFSEAVHTKVTDISEKGNCSCSRFFVFDGLAMLYS